MDGREWDGEAEASVVCEGVSFGAAKEMEIVFG